jgi:hypothetical protein
MGLEKKLTSEWVGFDGNYEKTLQDIQLQDGTQVNRCWPNAGSFICFSDNSQRDIPYKEVKMVRKTHYGFY